MEQVMRYEDFISMLEESGKDATSEFHLRNEDIQSKDRTSRIPKIKKEKKKKEKLLIPVELALPFNPITGKPDDKYNASTKFRPIMAATSVALMLKELASRSEVTKNALMARAGVEVWDTSETDKLTEEDKAIFKKYRVPVIYTMPVVNINIPAMTGQFARDYMIDVERDEITGELVDYSNEPLVLQANRFFRDMAYEEIQAYQEKVDKGLIRDSEKAQKEFRSGVYGKNPVSDDHPSNWIICLDLPMNSTYKLDTDKGIDYAAFTEEDVHKSLGLIKLSKAFNESLTKYKTGEWVKYDRYFDYWEIDMCCPAEGDTPQELGQATTYEKPTEEILDAVQFNKINAAFLKYLDNRADVEKVFIASVRIAPYNEKVETQLAGCLSTVIDVESEWLTKEVIKRHSEFLTIVLGNQATDLLLDVEMDTDDRAAGVLDAGKAKEEYDLNKIMTTDAEDVDLDEVDLLAGSIE